MNTPTPPTAAEVQAMLQFLERVRTIPLTAVKVTGSPETDENVDILLSYKKRPLDAGGWEEELEKLCAVKAIEIEAILGGLIDPLENGQPDLIRGAELYADFIAEKKPLYQ